MTRQEYFDKLMVASKGGDFPCVDDVEGVPVYRNGTRSCVIGILFPEDSWPRFGTITYWMRRPERGWAKYMPEGMTVEELQAVQDSHDSMTNVSAVSWDHDQFVHELKSRGAFIDLIQ